MKRKFYIFIFSVFSIVMFSMIFAKGEYLKNTPKFYCDNEEKIIFVDAKKTKRENLESEIIHKKVIFLTFDDGPSYGNTNRILDILKEEKVKASFFVIGNNLKNHPNTINRMKEDKMDILPHCTTHNYKEIYKDRESYLTDLNNCINSINKNTDNSFNKISRKFIRFPGGSDNLVSKKCVLDEVKEILLNEDINYIDWNVSSQDASSFIVPQDTIVSNIKRTGEYWNIGVVLFHDSEVKKSTPEALPEIIKFYKDRGYVFKKISEMNSHEFNYLVKNRVINKN